jgi:hypothetical protein
MKNPFLHLPQRYLVYVFRTPKFLTGLSQVGHWGFSFFLSMLIFRNLLKDPNVT